MMRRLGSEAYWVTRLTHSRTTMRNVLLISAASMFLFNLATAADTTSAPVRKYDALSICKDGVRTPHALGASACWTTYYGALQTKRLAEASRITAIGCTGYRRPYFCALSAKPVSTMAAQSNGPKARLTVVDLEDAELAYAIAEYAYWAQQQRPVAARQSAGICTSRS